MDEPTSGLDSVAAFDLCVLLREISHAGKCAVTHNLLLSLLVRRQLVLPAVYTVR